MFCMYQSLPNKKILEELSITISLSTKSETKQTLKNNRGLRLLLRTGTAAVMRSVKQCVYTTCHREQRDDAQRHHHRNHYSTYHPLRYYCAATDLRPRGRCARRRSGRGAPYRRHSENRCDCRRRNSAGHQLQRKRAHNMLLDVLVSSSTSRYMRSVQTTN